MKKKLVALILALCMFAPVMYLPASAAAKVVKVIFDAGDYSDKPETKVVLEGGTYGELPTPARSGYVFTGWYYETAYEESRVTPSTTVKSGMTHYLYAYWSPQGADPDKTYTVTFDPNGGSGRTSATVFNGQRYSFFPEVARQGYAFDGWYTAPTGGKRIYERDRVSLTGDQTLYARWWQPATTIVFYYAAPGVLWEQYKVVKYGETLGELPTPVRPNYRFTGWVTEDGRPVDSGTVVDTREGFGIKATWEAAGPAPQYTIRLLGPGKDHGTITVTSGQTYGRIPDPEPREGYEFLGWNIIYRGRDHGYAREDTPIFLDSEDYYLEASWRSDSAAYAYTVTFDAAGGSVGETTRMVMEKEAYGSLPTPTRPGYSFDGWYTAAGTKVTSGTTVTGDHTLYARWTKKADPVKTPTVPGLSYSFGNSHQGFGYSYSYYIPEERYLLFYSSTMAKTLYNSHRSWGGNCFGMSATANMFFVDGNNVSTAAFRSGASAPSQLAVGDRNGSWGLSLRDFIEAMQISQYSNQISRDYWDNQNDIDGLVKAVRNFRSTGKDPVIVTIYGASGGHAVVGYDVAEVDSAHSDLKVYDCNYPNDTGRAIRLTKNSAGKYTGWYYYLNNTEHWGSAYGGNISHVPYSHYMDLWNGRNGGGNVNLLNVNVPNATVKDSRGKVVAAIKNGQVTPYSSDVYPMLDTGAAGSGSAWTSLWLPADEVYSVINNSTGTGTFEATMVNVDQSAAVSTSSREVTLAVVDSEELNYVGVSAGSRYEITMTSELGSGPDSVRLEGTAAAAQTAVAQVGGELYAQGVSGGASLQINGAAASLQQLSRDWPSLGRLPGSSGSTDAAFTDLPGDPELRKAVNWAVENGVTAGIGDNRFGPDNPCTRAQIVTFLWNSAGKPEPAARSNPFVDVKSSDYFYKAVLWAKEKNIVAGTDLTHFSPNARCTRGQVLTMLWRWEGSPTARSGGAYADVSPKAYYAAAADWAAETGVADRTSRFGPNETATRGQFVVFLFRSRGK